MLKVREAAIILNLNPQTVYRKIMRGEIPCVRVGKSVRIREEDLYNKSARGTPVPVTTSTSLPVPGPLYDLFWDCDPSTLSSFDEIVIERILDQGDISAVDWLLTYCSPSRIKNYLQSKGKRRLSNRSLNYWSRYFAENSSGGIRSAAAGIMGQDRWR